MTLPFLRPTDPPAAHLWRPAVLAGSLLGSGFAPVLRGTAGTALVAAPSLALLWVPDPARWVVWAALGLVFSVLSLLTGRAVLRAYPALKDPSWFVLDEAAGFFVTCAVFGAGTGLDICFAFLTFRLYDICKPWPVRMFERLAGSVGILADDLAAAVLAGLSCWGLRALAQLV
jgi:phosphatidylglycerophosphatase A